MTLVTATKNKADNLIAIVVSGGVVQSVLCENEELRAKLHVLVIDYDGDDNVIGPDNDECSLADLPLESPQFSFFDLWKVHV